MAITFDISHFAVLLYSSEEPVGRFCAKYISTDSSWSLGEFDYYV